MGNPRITYNSIDIDLVLGKTGLVQMLKQNRNQNESASGMIETINLFGRFDYRFDSYFSEQVYFDLIAWWSWARQGKAWSFALDSAKVGNTTLDGSAPAAQKTIPLTATADFAIGDFCLIRTADLDDEMEIVEIDTISAGVSIDVIDDLKFSYDGGDYFSHKDYFPSVLATKKEFQPTITGVKDVTLKFYSHIFEFTENFT